MIIVNIFLDMVKEIWLRKEEVLIKGKEIESQIMLLRMLIHLMIIAFFTELETLPLRSAGFTNPVTVLNLDMTTVA